MKKDLEPKKFQVVHTGGSLAPFYTWQEVENQIAECSKEVEGLYSGDCVWSDGTNVVRFRMDGGEIAEVDLTERK